MEDYVGTTNQFVVIGAYGEVLNKTKIDVIDLGILERVDNWQYEGNATTESAISDNLSDILDVYNLCEKHGYRQGCDLIRQWLSDRNAGGYLPNAT